MTIDHNWLDDVYREKSLHDVYKASSVIEPNKFNRQCMQACAACCILYVLFNVYTGVDNGEILKAIIKISGSMITITTAILGFLIAGFSIFVSSTPSATLIMLVNARYKKTNISYFKQIMFNFLNVLTVYLISLVLSLGINTAAPLRWSPLIKFRVPIVVITTFNSIILSIIILSAIYSVLRLKSFIWTMYQGLLVNMMLDRELNQNRMAAIEAPSSSEPRRL